MYNNHIPEHGKFPLVELTEKLVGSLQATHDP